MWKIKTFFVLPVILSLISCSGIRVNQDYDLSAVFGQYRTFAISSEPSKKSGDFLIDSPFMDQRIRTAIENTMIFKGYPKVSEAAADFWVTYQITATTRIEVDRIPAFGWGVYPYGLRYPYYYHPYWDGFGYETYVRQYEEGTLIIDFLDSKTQKLFWRGVGSRRISQQSPPEKMTEWVNQIISEMLAQYPPLPTGR